jgi:hypothetical protein
MSLSNNFSTTKPSLQLNFTSGVDSIDPRITFTRNSTASYVNDKGYIAYANVNQPRLDHDPVTRQPLGLLIERTKRNYLASACDFTTNNGYWTLPQADSNFIYPNRAYAPDGTLSADLLLNSTTSSRHTIGSTGVSVVTTLDYTASIFVKAYESTTIPVAITLYCASSYQAGDRFGTGFNIAAGTLNLVSPAGNGVVYNQSAEYYGNGWWRISVSGTTGLVGTNNLSLFIGLSSTITDGGVVTTYAGDGGAGFYVWGAQLEQSKQQSSFIPSTETFVNRPSIATYIGSDGLIKTATANTARYTYSVLDLTIPPRLLYEPAATNLYNYSEQINTYSLAHATITANSAIAPDGTMNADKLVEDTSTNHHDAHQTMASVTAGVAMTVSAFFKAAERSMVTLEFVPASSFANAIAPVVYFSLTTGAVANVVNTTTKDTSIIYYGNGWYRCSATVTPLTGGTLICNMGMTAGLSNTETYTGDGTSGLFIWGAQAEVGNVATSYIPTGATTVTRAADVVIQSGTDRQAEDAIISGANFNSWYNNDQGTLVTESMIKHRLNSNHNTVRIGGSPYYAWQHGLYLGSSDVVYGARYGTGGKLLSTVSTVLGTYNKISTSYNLSTGNITTRTNGAGAGTATDFLPNAVEYSSPTSLQIGQTSGAWYLDGWIKNITYYPEEFTAAQLTTITKRA